MEEKGDRDETNQAYFLIKINLQTRRLEVLYRTYVSSVLHVIVFVVSVVNEHIPLFTHLPIRPEPYTYTHTHTKK